MWLNLIFKLYNDNKHSVETKCMTCVSKIFSFPLLCDCCQLYQWLRIFKTETARYDVWLQLILTLWHERMLAGERSSLHRTSQDWGLWRRAQERAPSPPHYHKPHYLHKRALSPQLCYSSLDLGLDYRLLYGRGRSRDVSSSLASSRVTSRSSSSPR